MTVINSRPIVRTSGRFKLYFYCPEKMSRIKDMCENTSYEDMTLTVVDVNIPNHSVEHKIKFGEGWMGKDAGIVCASDYHKNPKGIYILVKLPYDIKIDNCRLESPEDTIQLGEITETINNWFPGSVAFSDFQEWQVQSDAAWENYTEEEKKIRKDKEDHDWAHMEFSPPKNKPVRAGMEGVLTGRDD
jgi:hypothetical protein